MIVRRQQLHGVGDSDMLIIPALIEKAKTVSMAVERLMLVDPIGEATPDQLASILREVVEPYFYRMLDAKK